MDLMQIRRKMIMQKPDIPLGYRKIDWLRSSGSQYIDTLYYPNTNTTVDLTFKYNGSSSQDRNPFGIRERVTVADDISIWTNTSSSKGIAVHYPIADEVDGTDTGWVYHGNIKNNPVHLVVSPETIKVNDTTVYTFDVERTYYSLIYTAWLFAARQGESSTIRTKDSYTVYGLTLSEGSKMCKNFIPCVRIRDNKPGMWESVGGAFYTNAGTGEFTIPT